MPRRQTPLQIGNFYHIYNRGNNHQSIFFERENYIYFLRLIKQHIISNGIDMIAYCLMPNHYHFLVYLNNDNLSDSMKSLSLAYTKAVNKRFNRSGVLFQGRFQSILVSNTEYLINLCQYIHLNPVKAGIVEQPGEWEFSSYLEYAGLRPGKLPKIEYIKHIVNDESIYQQFLTDHDLPKVIEFKKLLIDD
ncbi:MAG: transposase [Nostocales cyanobacterium]|nr:MAG: transposase [Nostocales cyanobacterium]